MERVRRITNIGKFRRSPAPSRVLSCFVKAAPDGVEKGLLVCDNGDWLSVRDRAAALNGKVLAAWLATVPNRFLWPLCRSDVCPEVSRSCLELARSGLEAFKRL
jgi:hypothetical protein